MKKLLLICLLSLFSLAPSPNVPPERSKHSNFFQERYEAWKVISVGWQGSYGMAYVEYPEPGSCVGKFGTIMYIQSRDVRPGRIVLFRLFDGGPAPARALWWWPDWTTFMHGNQLRNLPRSCWPNQLRAR